MKKSLRFIAVLMTLPLILVSCSNNNSEPGGSGLIEATEAVLSATTGGTLLALYTDEGQLISKSDTFALIDTLTTTLQRDRVRAMKQAAETNIKTASLNIEKAALNFTLAEKDYDRAKNLIKTGSMNQQQYDKIETGYNQAELASKQSLAAKQAAEADLNRIKADLALLEKQYRDCFPTAPESGVVTDKFVEVGELVNMGSPLIKVAAIDTVTVKVYLPASDLTKIKLNDTARIDPEDNTGRTLEGTVVWISSEAEFTPKNVQTKEARANLVYAVKISIPNPDQILKIGMPVAVTIP